MKRCAQPLPAVLGTLALLSQAVAAPLGHEVRQAPPPAVSGSVYFDGWPITEFTRIKPTFWLRNEQTNKAQDAEVRFADGGYSILALPKGRYGMNARIDANLANPLLYPGDYDSWTTFEVGEQPARVDIHVYRVLHLLKPFDTSQIVPGRGDCEDKPAHDPGLELAWQGLAPGMEYDYSIERVVCPYRDSVRVAGGRTAETGARVFLPPSGPGQFYLLRLSAYKDGRRIGGLLSHGANYLAWDYRFVVK